MSKRLKVTPFARFFLAMLVIAPLAYIGASFLNGQDGLQNIKNLFNGEKTEVVQSSEIETTSTTNETSNTNTNTNDNSNTDAGTATTAELKKLQEDLDYKNQRIEELLKENEQLKEKNAALERQVAGEDGQ